MNPVYDKERLATLLDRMRQSKELEALAVHDADDIDEYLSGKEQDMAGVSMDGDMEISFEIGKRTFIHSMAIFQSMANKENDPIAQLMIYRFLVAVVESSPQSVYDKSKELDENVPDLPPQLAQAMGGVPSGPVGGEDESFVPGTSPTYD